MTATYWQRGESLDYYNDTDSTIECDTIIDLNTRIGVAGADIDPEETGSVHVEGVYELTKADSTEEITLGAAVYYTADTGVSASDTTGTPAGYAVAASEADDETVLVKLLG